MIIIKLYWNMNATFRVSGYQVSFIFCCVHWFTWSILLLIKKKKSMIIDSTTPACKICYGLVLDMIVIIFVILISIFATTTRVLTSRCEEMRFYLHSYGHLANNNSEVLSLEKILHVARPSLNASIIVEEIEGVSGWRCVKLLKICTGAELAVLGWLQTKNSLLQPGTALIYKW